MRELAAPWWEAALFLALLAFLCLGLSSYGIWDPWELDVAHGARALIDGEATERSSALVELVGAAFGMLGVREWSGRLPIAISAWLCCVVSYAIVVSMLGRRVAIVAAIVTATTPLLLLNGRHMLGAAPAFLAQGLVALCAIRLALYEKPPGRASLVGWSLALVASLVFSTWASGVMIGPLPPLCAVALSTLLLRERLGAQARNTGLALCAVSLVATVMVATSVARDASTFSLWLGSAPTTGEPPTFDAIIERVFHSFAPWSALLVGGGACLFGTRNVVAAHAKLVTVSLLWVAFGYAAATVYLSRYGSTTFVPVVALAILAAIALDDLARQTTPQWPAALLSLLLVGLLIRDFSLYPAAPISGLPADGLALPDAYNPRATWAVAIGGFGLMLALAMVADTRPGAMTKIQPRVWLKGQWARGGLFRLWLILGALLVVAVIVYGALCYLIALPLPTVAIRVGRRLLLVALLVGIGAACFGRLRWAIGRLGQNRVVLPLVAALVVAGYTLWGFDREVSAHFSPRTVYATFDELAQPDEALGLYRSDERAASYYTDAEVKLLSNRHTASNYLAEPSRRWVVMPDKELAQLNLDHRKRSQRHLFVVPTDSARFLLVTNQAVQGYTNANFIADTVLSNAPEVEHRVGADFDGKVELVGYNLGLPAGDSVGAGQKFTVTWIWHAKHNAIGSYRVFLHIDGHGRRLNGDHIPVDERYPVKNWRAGDFIVDEQSLKVPADYPPGDYAMMIGLFSGSKRLTVKTKHDGENRVRAGTLTVR